MFMVETDSDVPGYREDRQFTDEEIEDMAQEELSNRDMEEAMARDLPYVNYEFALSNFLEVAKLQELRAARARIDGAIVAYLVKARDMAEAAVELRAETKSVMREFKIPDPERKPRDYSAAKKSKP